VLAKRLLILLAKLNFYEAQKDKLLVNNIGRCQTLCYPVFKGFWENIKMHYPTTG
jgi:hypothetical protein